jgi:hypothetical protein
MLLEASGKVQDGAPPPSIFLHRIKRIPSNVRLLAGGLGGCPYAPVASGNVVSEDLFQVRLHGEPPRLRPR